jgi:hypothetical protein
MCASQQAGNGVAGPAYGLLGQEVGIAISRVRVR